MDLNTQNNGESKRNAVIALTKAMTSLAQLTGASHEVGLLATCSVMTGYAATMANETGVPYPHCRDIIASMAFGTIMVSGLNSEQGDAVRARINAEFPGTLSNIAARINEIRAELFPELDKPAKKPESAPATTQQTNPNRN